MKLQLACLLVLGMFSAGAVGQRQNLPQSRKTGSVPRTQTIRICQGVPIPDGYVIVAYMTSTACPHGAYILKKQDPSETALAVSRKASALATEDSGTRSNESGNRSLSSRNNSPAKSAREPLPATGSNEPAQALRNGSQSAKVTSNAVPASRQRRVTAEKPEEQTSLPVLIGSETARSVAPPKLIRMGTPPEPTTTDTRAPDADPKPEEVDENDVVRVDTMLVTVPVSVLDRQGRFIPGLKSEDFALLENGEPQSIAYFETAEKPFTVALLLDTSASTHFHLDEIKAAAIAFAKQLRPQDRILVVTFNSEVLLLSEATNDLNLMEAAIEEYANSGTATRLYDAVDLTIQERLNRIKGRKAIVIFTDGVDTASQQATYQSTLNQIQELDALIYPIQYDTTDYLQAMQGAGSVTVTTTQLGPFGTTTSKQTYNVPRNGGAPLPGATKADYDRADQYLHALADRTGGRLYQANNTNQLTGAFSRIAEELRRQYTLGYYPNSANIADGEERQIRVRVRQPNFAVKARHSYIKSSASQK